MSALNNAALENKLEHNLEQKLERGLVEDEALLLNKRNSREFAQNPLDRNGDGRVDAKDFVGSRRLSRGYDASLPLTNTTYVQTAQRSSIQAHPTVLETIQKDVVVHERIHPIQKEEVQPIIYREREQLDVKQVTQMMHETQIQPTLIQQRELPAERREAVVQRGAAIQENVILPTTTRDATLRTQVVHAPIVNEVIKKTVIEEIQPVLERDIIQSTVIQNTQPIYEKVVEAPSVYRETVVISQDRGIVGGSLAELEAQGFNLGLTGRRLSQTYSQTTMSQGLNLDRNGDGLVDARDFAGQTSALQSETLVTSHGLRRKSLKEALPNSYTYLGESLDGKIVQDQTLAPKTVL